MTSIVNTIPTERRKYPMIWIGSLYTPDADSEARTAVYVIMPPQPERSYLDQLQYVMDIATGDRFTEWVEKWQAYARYHGFEFYYDDEWIDWIDGEWMLMQDVDHEQWMFYGVSPSGGIERFDGYTSKENALEGCARLQEKNYTQITYPQLEDEDE